MNPHELSDADADALTITTQGDRTWITCTSGNSEVTVGPFATDAIAAGFPADPMDGGVTAALVEKEAEGSVPAVDYHAMWWKAEREREKAERERDEAIAFMTEAQEEATRQAVRAEQAEENATYWENTSRAQTGALQRAQARADAAESRPLTPDTITDEMVKRARVAWLGANINLTPNGFVREILTAALTEPPARPDWQDLADTLRDIDPAETLSIDELAEAAHKRGVYVVTGERS